MSATHEASPFGSQGAKSRQVKNPFTKEHWEIERRRKVALAEAEYFVRKQAADDTAEKRFASILRCRNADVALDDDGNPFVAVEDGRPVYATRDCGHALCPSCARRASAQFAHKIEEDMRRIGGEVVFVTFTRRGQEGEPLAVALDSLVDAFERLRRSVAWKRAQRGTLLKIEVTRGQEGKLWHVHAHALVALHKDDAGKVCWINQAACLKLWRRCLRQDIDRDGGFRIERRRQSAIAEAAKYIAKPQTLDEDAEVLRELVKTLRGRHMYRRWGCWICAGENNPMEKTNATSTTRKEREASAHDEDIDLLEGKEPSEQILAQEIKKDDDKKEQEDAQKAADEELFTSSSGAVYTRDELRKIAVWDSSDAANEKLRALLFDRWEHRREMALLHGWSPQQDSKVSHWAQRQKYLDEMAPHIGEPNEME